MLRFLSNVCFVFLAVSISTEAYPQVNETYVNVVKHNATLIKTPEVSPVVVKSSQVITAKPQPPPNLTVADTVRNDRPTVQPAQLNRTGQVDSKQQATTVGNVLAARKELPSFSRTYLKEVETHPQIADVESNNLKLLAAKLNCPPDSIEKCVRLCEEKGLSMGHCTNPTKNSVCVCKHDDRR